MNFRCSIFWLMLSSQCVIILSQTLESQKPEPYESYQVRSEERPTSRDTIKSTYPAGDMLPNNDILYDTCNADDFACLAMAASDKLGLEAISSLHRKLDDDANGNVDLSESNDFLREELKYDSGFEKRQRAFHRNDDMHISVKELWEAWLRSEVHNWTIEQTTEWLTTCVELPQYVPNFIQYRVTGAHLPRLAVNNMNYLNALGIKDPIHKQKISLKAMDVVLFGPPKDGHTYWKDLILIFLTLAAGFGIWYAVQQNKKFRNHLNRMNRDMDSLQKAESALKYLQKELEEAKQAQESVISEKENLEKRLQTGENGTLHSSYSDLEVSQLKAEIDMLRTELQIAEGELKDRCWAPPPALQQWLQLTHEIEYKAYIKKKISAEKQLQQAKEACEKLRKKRSSLVGAFVSTHGKSIDDVDRSIVEARTALQEVTHELQERVHRWKQIEMLCGFNIMNNNGLQYLENALYTKPNGGRNLGFKVSRMSSQDDLDDDTGSVYSLHQVFGESFHQSKEDSSGSEISRQDDDDHVQQTVVRSSPQNIVHFSVGGEVPSFPDEASSLHNARMIKSSAKSLSNNNICLAGAGKTGSMVRSVSQDVTTVGSMDTSIIKPKSSQSDTSLDHYPPARAKPLKQMTIKEQPSVSIEDDICSTDSSVMDDDIKKKKRKLFGFTKKSKTKGD